MYFGVLWPELRPGKRSGLNHQALPLSLLSVSCTTTGVLRLETLLCRWLWESSAAATPAAMLQKRGVTGLHVYFLLVTAHLLQERPLLQANAAQQLWLSCAYCSTLSN